MGVIAPVQQLQLGTRVSSQADEFTALVKQYRVRAFHFALQMVGNSEDAMDVTQEAFLRLHRHWNRRDPARGPSRLGSIPSCATWPSTCSESVPP